MCSSTLHIEFVCTNPRTSHSTICVLTFKTSKRYGNGFYILRKANKTIYSQNSTILYYTILYYTILYRAILNCIILYYTILYYTILYYTVPYHTIMLHASLPWGNSTRAGRQPPWAGRPLRRLGGRQAWAGRPFIKPRGVACCFTC